MQNMICTNTEKKSHLKILSIFCVLLAINIFFSENIFAQENNLRFESITINDGLSQGTIRCILHDSKGFMWFGTQDGLNRYDGYSFKIFRNEINSPYSISGNYITCIDEDIHGNLWIGTLNGLNKFERNSYRFIKYSPSKETHDDAFSNTIYSVLTSKTDQIIWYSNRQGLFELNYKTGKSTRYQYNEWNKKDGNINKIFQYDKNTLLLVVSLGVIYKFDINTKKFEVVPFRSEKNIKRTHNIITVVKDSKSNIWVASYEGLYKYNLNTHESVAYHPSSTNKNSLMGDVIMSLAIDKNDVLWMSMMNYGLARLDINTNTITNYYKDNPDFKPTSSIINLFLDKSGILWLGTNGYGINKLNPYINNFSFYTKGKDGLEFSSIRTFTQDKNQNLYVGGYGGINKINLPTGKISYLKDIVKQNLNSINTSIYVLEIDKDNPNKYLWMGTEGGGLFKLDIQTGALDNKPFDDLQRKQKINQGIYSILDDGEGNLWVGSYTGLYIINKKTYECRNYEYNPSNQSSISPHTVTKIFKDSEGKMWIGTDIGGLCLLDKKNYTFKRFSFDPNNKKSISSNYVKTIFEDSKKRLWIGTNGGGLNLFDRRTNKFIRITSEEGLPNDVIYGILEDESGNLWLSSNKGICKFNYDKNTFMYFDVRDGLQSNEFNTNAYYQNNSGVIFFGGVNGFNSFNPNKFYSNNCFPNVAIINFELFSKPVGINQIVDGRIVLDNSIEQTKQIELDYDENVFSLEFASLDYGSPLKNKYSYMMEGFDKKWTSASAERKATYTNLHPGRYVFKVNGTNNKGLWSTKHAELIIIIVPPFWQTWWFIVICVFLVAGILFYAYYRRINTIQEQKELLEKEVKARTSDLEKVNNELKKSEDELRESNNSKDKFFSILAHDLRGPFGGVIGLSEILVEDIDELDKQEIKQLSHDINELLHEQFILLENLLGWSRIQMNKYYYEPESINLSEIADRVARFLSNNAKSKEVSIVSEVPDKIYVIGNSTMILSIVQNLIANAIKFTNGGGTINLIVLRKDNFAEIIVEDNGVGMNEETLSKIFKTDILKSTDGTAKEKGSGLGLMLVKEFVVKMDGDVKVESELGKGTKFTVKIPLSEENI
jgi:signal transduction histidine kinase/ligand-binding sensor domain-containing protein